MRAVKASLFNQISAIIEIAREPRGITSLV